MLDTFNVHVDLFISVILHITLDNDVAQCAEVGKPTYFFELSFTLQDASSSDQGGSPSLAAKTILQSSSFKGFM